MGTRNGPLKMYPGRTSHTGLFGQPVAVRLMPRLRLARPPRAASLRCVRVGGAARPTARRVDVVFRVDGSAARQDRMALRVADPGGVAGGSRRSPQARRSSCSRAGCLPPDGSPGTPRPDARRAGHGGPSPVDAVTFTGPMSTKGARAVTAVRPGVRCPRRAAVARGRRRAARAARPSGVRCAARRPPGAAGAAGRAAR